MSAVPARAAAARHALGGGGVRALAAGECMCVRVSARRRGLLAGERADDVAAQIEDGSYSEREWFRREEANGSNGGREEAAMERSASGLREHMFPPVDGPVSPESADPGADEPACRRFQAEEGGNCGGRHCVRVPGSDHHDLASVHCISSWAWFFSG